jgi:hypothetical protein
MPDHPDPERACAEFIGALEHIAAEEWIDGPVPDIGRRLAMARWILVRIQRAVNDMSDALALSMEEDSLTVDGFGILKRTPIKSSRWRYEESAQRLRDDVRDAVVSSIAMDIATGEVDPVKRNIARVAIDRVWDIVPSFSTIKAAGRSYDLDINEYRDFVTVNKIELYEELP